MVFWVFIHFAYLKNLLQLICFMVNVVIDKDLIKKVAQNARLKLTDEELERFVPQIKEVIIESFNKLDEIDAKEDPSFQPIKMDNAVRPDVFEKSLLLEDVLKNANPKLRENGYFKGPKVL